jgi:hypothetical protein
MRKVDASEILPLGEYEKVRDSFRARVIAEKKLRRVSVGPRVSAVFENHDTVLLQIQEMLRTERITRPSAVQHEIETYNELIPAKNELSATVMIEIEDKAEREKFLVDAVGFEDAVALEVAGERFAARYEPHAERDTSRRTTAVHYFKFSLSEQAARAIRERRAGVAIVVDHRAYQARAELPAAGVASLAEDLAEDA